MATLKKCPFCGGDAVMLMGDDWCVECKSCLATTTHYSTEADAIAAWNFRAEPTFTREWRAKTIFGNSKINSCQVRFRAERRREMKTNKIYQNCPICGTRCSIEGSGDTHFYHPIPRDEEIEFLREQVRTYRFNHGILEQAIYDIATHMPEAFKAMNDKIKAQCGKTAGDLLKEFK